MGNQKKRKEAPAEQEVREPETKRARIEENKSNKEGGETTAAGKEEKKEKKEKKKKKKVMGKKTGGVKREGKGGEDANTEKRGRKTNEFGIGNFFEDVTILDSEVESRRYSCKEKGCNFFVNVPITLRKGHIHPLDLWKHYIKDHFSLFLEVCVVLL